MPFLEAGEDRGGVTIAGDTQVAAANDTRRGLTFQNTSDTDMRVTEHGGAATAATGYLIKASQAVNISTNLAVHVYCAAAGKTFAATEF